MNPEIDLINQRIAERYGNHPEFNLPMFRVVWSDAEIEPQRNSEMFYGNIFIGIEKGIKMVPKYSFTKERWILEKLFPNNPETSNVVSRHTYEPIYTFTDKNDKPLFPNFRIVNILCWISMYSPRKRFSMKDCNEAERKAFEADAAYMEEFLNNKNSEYGLSTGEGIIVP